jgi:hypothetical protein
MTTPGGVCRVPDCDALVADAWVCSTCAHRLRVALTDAPDLLAELDVDITRQGRRERQPGRVSGEPLLPFDVTASIVRDALVSTLRTWALVLAGDLLGAPPAPDGTGLAAHLAGRLEEIRHHVEGGALVDEITAAVTAARDQIHGRDHTTTVLAGYCPHCQSAVYAPRNARDARCGRDGCSGTVDPLAWRESALQALDGDALTAADAARALTALGTPVTAARIRQWAARDRIRPVWADHLRRPLYPLATIRALLTQSPHTPMTSKGA